uniref:glycoside hydrolase family 2 TIM barrel-domain containing protein n=1 Tax=uncultured Gemmiger sp. TaxID=1623490 RepID=UPI0025E3827B
VQMCERYGFYLIDEADIECHGVTTVFGGGDETTFGLIAQSKDFEPLILDRVRRCIIRDKNSPAVIIWSLGNESGYGPGFEKAGRWGKNYDPTRLMHYEGSWHQTGGHVNDTSMLDIYSRMYNEPDFVRGWLADPANTKPFLLVEYCHAMGNGPGDLEDYEQLFLQEPGVLGGFVWEWCDHAIDAGPAPNGGRRYLYGGDSEEYPHDINFCVDGLVSPNRKPHTGLAELKNVWRPLRAGLEGETLVLRSTLDFADVGHLANCRWELALDGIVVREGTLPLPSIPPRSRVTLPTPWQLPRESGRVDVRLIYTAAGDNDFVKAGDELGFDQLTLRQAAPTLTTLRPGTVTCRETQEEILVEGSGFSYAFDRFTGCFDSMVRQGQEQLSRPMGFNVWRAPTDNDRKIRRVWEEAGYDRVQTRVENCRVESGETVRISCDVTLASVIRQPFLHCRVMWEIDAEGTLRLTVDGRRDMVFPFLPRFGVRLFLNSGFEQLDYIGYGPLESYLDKHRACWYGRFKSTVADEYVDYIKPQEHGSHMGCDAMQLQNGNTAFWAKSEAPFSFRASHYPQEDLAAAAHDFELTPADDVEVCLDYKNSGIGSNSCGPVLDPRYALNEETFHFTIIMGFAALQ